MSEEKSIVKREENAVDNFVSLLRKRPKMAAIMGT